jgi:hypothetical protein
MQDAGGRGSSSVSLFSFRYSVPCGTRIAEYHRQKQAEIQTSITVI